MLTEKYLFTTVWTFVPNVLFSEQKTEMNIRFQPRFLWRQILFTFNQSEFLFKSHCKYQTQTDEIEND